MSKKKITPKQALENNRLNVAATREAYKSLGLSQLVLWLPQASFARFRQLAVCERLSSGCALKSDKPDTELLDSPESVQLAKLKQIIEAAELNAHPTSPRWEYGRRLLKDLKEVLE